MKATDEQLCILRHMLGINTPRDRTPQPDRNHYAASPGDAAMLELESLGAVRYCGERFGYHHYECTDAGRAAAMASHKTIRYTKARRVYIKFLSIKVCFADLTFREFLTDPEFRQTRAEA